MTSLSMSQESVIKATGKSWNDWFAYLDEINARQLSHKDIAVLLQEKPGVSGWWAQSITVEYERNIGRREIGQTGEGNFQGAASKTLPGNLDQVFIQWKEYVGQINEVNKTPFKNPPAVSESPKWRYWRVTLQDGSKVAAVINQKSTDKVLLAINHEKLGDAKAVEEWKAFWKTFLNEFRKWIY
jgi:hypothetical protein